MGVDVSICTKNVIFSTARVKVNNLWYLSAGNKLKNMRVRDDKLMC